MITISVIVLRTNIDQLLKFPPIRHCGHHLGQLILMTLQNTIHVLLVQLTTSQVSSSYPVFHELDQFHSRMQQDKNQLQKLIVLNNMYSGIESKMLLTCYKIQLLPTHLQIILHYYTTTSSLSYEKQGLIVRVPSSAKSLLITNFP